MLGKRRWFVYGILLWLPSALWAAALEGIVYDGGFGLANARVSVAEQQTLTNETGQFRFENLAPGKYTLRITHPRTRKSVEIPVEVASDGVTYVEYDFAPPPSLSEVVVTARAEAPEPSRQTILGSEIQRVAGTGKDVLRALQVLPGVTTANDLSGELFIRGGGPQDNTFYFDRTELFYPYHFGGLVSTLSSELIDRVDVHAGGFGAQFGDAQAIIDIHSREPEGDQLKLTANVNMTLSELYLESALGRRGSFYLAGRRSYMDLIIPHVIEIERLTAFPRFWDYQLGVHYDLSSAHHMRFNAFGSQDFMELKLREEDVTEQPELAGKFHYRNGFTGQGVTLRSRLGERGTLYSTLSHTQMLIDLQIGQGYFLRLKPRHFTLRESLEYVLGSRHTLQVGGDASYIRARSSAFFVHPPEEGDPYFDFTSEPKVRSDSIERVTFLSGYVQDQIAFRKWLTFTLGLRVGYFSRTGRLSWDPRLRLSFGIPGGARLTAAWGFYHQTPQPFQISRDWGNPNVHESLATHYVLEIEREIRRNTRLTVAAYYKDLDDLITADPQQVYLNQGEGFARGIEVLLQHKPSERFFAWLSYAYSLSRRKDHPGAPERLYSYDQTHVATLTLSYRPSSRWEFGLKWHYATGTPYTPVVDARQTPQRDGTIRYVPVYGEINSRRLPPFHRLDLRVSRAFTPSWGRIEIYLEVLNAYYRKNVLAIDYNEDYSQEKKLYQLPIVPYLGFTMKF